VKTTLVAAVVVGIDPGTPCQGLLRHSTRYCPNPATYVIDVEDTMYAVCNEHLRAFRRDVRL
jgi:hypothetical protein